MWADGQNPEANSCPGSEKRLFGPFTYAALLAWGLVVIYSGVEIAAPKVQVWLEQREIHKGLRSSDIKTRQQVVSEPGKTKPRARQGLLARSMSDPSFDVSVAACRLLANQAADPRPLIPVLAAAANDDKIEVRVETARVLGRILAPRPARLVRRPTVWQARPCPSGTRASRSCTACSRTKLATFGPLRQNLLAVVVLTPRWQASWPPRPVTRSEACAWKSRGACCK